MPLQVRDPRHGHVARFHAPSTHGSAATAATAASAATAAPAVRRDVVWGSHSISVPSCSPLNGPADVWFRLPRLTPARARAWCQRHSAVQFLGLWREPRTLPASGEAAAATAAATAVVGFGFRVPHFSRYRFVDSDDSDDADDGAAASGDGTARPDEASRAGEPATPAGGQTPVRDDEGNAGQHGRLRRAGSTPARSRVNPGRRQQAQRGAPPVPVSPSPAAPAEQRRAQRPRMNTRDIVDLDDLTDPDDGTDPDPDNDNDRDMGRPPPQDGFHTPRYPDDGLGATPLDAAQDDVEEVLDVRPDAWRGGPADPQRLHRLRDALFTSLPHSPSPSRRRSMKTDGRLTDVDMADISSPSAAVAINLDEDESLDDGSDGGDAAWASDLAFAGDDGHDVEAAVTRAANDFAEDDSVPAPLVGDSFLSSTLPFPSISYSVVAKHEGLCIDPALSHGRAFRVTFSRTGDVLAPVFDVEKGFVVRADEVHEGQEPLERSFFSCLLASHCSVWYGAMEEVAETNEGPDAPHGEMGRTVRMPTFATAFRSGNVADDVMLQSITLMSLLHDGGDINARHAGILFAMLLALYKSVDVNENGESVDGIQCLLRRVAQWGFEHGGVTFDEGKDGLEGLQRAVVELALGKVDEAVEAAVEAGHLRLAMMIARALEGPKDELRDDALQQLRAYGLHRRRNGSDSDDIDDDDDDEDVDDGGVSDSRWDHILEECGEDANVSLFERMVLLILAGHVSPVARFLNFSWYRAFSMELLHGAGSSDEELWRRVAGAVQAVSRCGISTVTPHNQTNDEDVVYQILKLYTTDGDKLDATAKLYSPSGFGEVHQVMDWRFSWMLHQVLSAIIPEASPKGAGVILSDGLAAQLLANGMPLWAFYVMCCSGASDEVLKDALIRDWPNIAQDFSEVTIIEGVMQTAKEYAGDAQLPALDGQDGDENEGENEQTEPRSQCMDAEEFLKEVLGVPDAWICEARAVEARVSGDRMEECAQWLLCGDVRGATQSHTVLLRDVVPEAVVGKDNILLNDVCAILERLEGMACVPNWHCGGGLILGYLRHIAGVPVLRRVELDTLKDLVSWVTQYFEQAKSDVERCASVVIADGLLTAQRGVLMRVDAEQREQWFMSVLADLERVPCSRAVRLRLSGEYTIVTKYGWPASRRVAAALPAYRKYLETEETVGALETDVVMA